MMSVKLMFSAMGPLKSRSAKKYITGKCVCVIQDTSIWKLKAIGNV